MFADAGIRNGEYVFDPFIDFKEKLRMKDRWNVNLQAYLFRNFGLQIEVDHQRAAYYSDLKWYGWYMGKIYVPINHFEAPYWHSWSLTSINIALVVGGNEPLFGDFFPYITAGIGSYFIKGDQNLFLNRSRLGPRTEGTKVKLSTGLRYRLTPFLGINVRLTGETLWRNNPHQGISYYETLYEGPDQLSLEDYYLSGKIVRMGNTLIRSFSNFGIELGLELIFKSPQFRKE